MQLGPSPRHDLTPKCASGASRRQRLTHRWGEGSEEHGADASRGSHCRGLPAGDYVAAGRHARPPEGHNIPNLSRSALHRWLQRHGISRPPKDEAADKRSRFSCELRHADGKLIMFLAIDRVSKFTYVEFHERIGSMCGVAFLRAVAEAFPTKSPPCSPTIARSI